MKVREIKLTQADREALKELDEKGVVSSKLEGFDFKDIVVCKPWGIEYLVYELRSLVCAWVLHMKADGTGTSMHCHRNKITLIHVLKGKIWVKTLNAEFVLKAGEEVWIDKATFHSMGAIVENTILTEIESPSFKPDAIRLKDTWGRERQEYESQCRLVQTYKMYCPYKTHKEKNDLIIGVVKKAIKKWGI